MQKAQQRSIKPRALPDRGAHNRQRPLSSSSASSTSSPPGPPSTTTSVAKGKDGGNVDKLLFKNLVEMVPLVETLMDKKPNPAFTRRVSMVHTPAAPQVKKVSSTRSVQGSNSISAKKQKSPGQIASTVKKTPNRVPSSASKPLAVRNLKKEREELGLLQGQVNELEKKLVEKEEALKLAQNSIEQMCTVNEALEDVRRQLEEKELMVVSASSELNDAKIALADKQAALEKLEWEGRMSNMKVEELQGDVAHMSDEISVLMEVFEKLSPNDSDVYLDGEMVSLECEPVEFEDDIGEIDMDKMEQEIAAYMSALAAAKQNPDEKMLDTVAQERLRLQALVLSS
ncbi:hypothetical protein LUZ63_002191 [Rhynchospora breviuscula]|uniref:Uncharacterized protein n=1 Tax=Rhynchospora breviuscula TaxID=2022672 RepID=A0A9Q0CZA9_9POAL|nr:hypothetical protein LUZ63_002191 [Rhynchospora breviuscula]